MAPPFTYKTVTGTYTAPDGTAVVGDLRFIPSTTVFDQAGNVVVPALPITVTLDAYGQFDVDLLVTDDAQTTPSGWVWRVTELFSPQREWEFQLPTAASSPVAIADLTPVTETDVTYAYASLATVLTLDGRVDAAETTVAAAEAAAAASEASAYAALVYDFARPGVDVPGIVTATPVSVSAGPTTIVAGPSSGRRIVKQIWMSGPGGATVTLTLASTTITKISLRGGVFAFPVTVVIANGENLQATVTSGPVVFAPSYVDRADTVVSRLGLASGSTSGTLVASTGTDRVITQLWIASTSLTTGATITLAMGGVTIVDTVTVAAGALFTFDDPIELASGSSVTWAGDSTTAVTTMANGRSV